MEDDQSHGDGHGESYEKCKKCAEMPLPDEEQSPSPPPSTAADQSPLPQPTPGQRVFDALLPPDALVQILSSDAQPSRYALDRKRPALFKQAVSWGRMGPLKPPPTTGTTWTYQSRQMDVQRTSLLFSGDRPTYVKKLCEWIEARWVWLEKDTRFKARVQMETERWVELLGKTKPNGKNFRLVWTQMLMAAESPEVFDDYEMEGLELDLVASWLFSSSTSVVIIGNKFRKPPAAGSDPLFLGKGRSKQSATTSLDTAMPGGNPSLADNPFFAAKASGASSGKGPTTTNTGNTTTSGDNPFQAASKAPGASSGTTRAATISDTKAAGSKPSLAANATPGASFDKQPASSNATEAGCSSNQPPPVNEHSWKAYPFDIVDGWMQHTAEAVQDYMKLPSSMAEAQNLKLVPEVVVVSTLLLILDKTPSNVDSATWDTLGKIMGVAKFRAKQNDFGNRLDRKFEALCRKAKKAQVKKDRKLERKYQRALKEYEQKVAQYEERVAQEKAMAKIEELTAELDEKRAEEARGSEEFDAQG